MIAEKIEIVLNVGDKLTGKSGDVYTIDAFFENVDGIDSAKVDSGWHKFVAKLSAVSEVDGVLMLDERHLLSITPVTHTSIPVTIERLHR